MNNSEKEVKTEADSSSSDHPCPLALVTASNVRKATQCRERRPPTSPSQKQFMKLKLAHDSLIRGLITLVGKDGVKWKVNLKEEGSGSALCLGTGWKEFAKANGLKTGDYFTLESAWKNEIPMLSLVNTESASDRKERGESSKAMEKERSTDTSSIVQNRVVTLALETKDVKACTLNLPSEFVTAIGIKKLGKITFLGKDGMKWWGCLLSGNGSVAVGIGWRNFCEANGVKLGESFSLVLINEEEDTGRNIPKKKNLEREAESSSLDPSCFLATIWPSSLRYDTLNLPRSFVRSNGLETRCGGEIVLMNEKGKSWTLALKQKLSGSTYIRRGWRRFCSANVLKTGGVYTFKLIHSGRTPVLRLFFTESESESEERNVALKPFNLEKYILYFPVRFSRSHGINEEAKMTLLDKNGVKWSTDLRSEETSDRIRLVGGWQEFFKTNCMKPGESIIVKLIWEGDKSCVLKFCSKNLLGKKKAKMNNSETKVKTEADSSSSDHPCPLALVTASNVRKDTQCLRQDLCPTESNHDGTQGDNNKKKRLITLVGKDGVKWKVNLYEERSGSSLCLGKGWKEFAKANGLKTGEYFTLELVWENEIPMLSLVNTESASDRKQRGEPSKAMEKERSTDTSSIVQNRVVTLALETKDVKACTLHLPSEFVTAIGIKKLGKITLLGKDGMKWWGCLLSRDGTVAVGIGWRNFCEANGVKLGDSFSLVFINEEEDTGPVFKFSPNSGN
ncbi:hypothetical protein Bca101_039351 [Brassica carinata]